MAAALRGGARSQAKPRAGKPASVKRRPARPSGYAPGKLGAISHFDLPPKFAVVVVAGVVALGLVVGLVPERRGQRLLAGVGTGVDNQLGRLGLRVKTLMIQGASPMAEADIARAADVYKDQPLVGVDLRAIQHDVEQVGWVKSARVVRLFPDTIVVAVTERDSLAVWQHAGRTLVVDSNGQPIPEADPGRFPNLPLVVGEGANDAVPAILPILRGHPAVMQRLEALVRVDGRRWDLRTRDGGLIQLPATGEDSALIELDRLNQKSRILELGFERIDLRDPEMVAVRPREASPAQPAVASNGV